MRTSDVAASRRHRPMPALLCVVAVAAVALAGGTAAWGAAKSPCKLVTVAEAAKVLGAPVAAKKVKTNSVDGCFYTHGARTLSVGVRAISRGLFDTEAQADPGPVVAVSGIGSDAYSIADATALLVWTHGTELVVQIVGDATALKDDKMLAKKALSRL